MTERATPQDSQPKAEAIGLPSTPEKLDDNSTEPTKTESSGDDQDSDSKIPTPKTSDEGEQPTATTEKPTTDEEKKEASKDDKDDDAKSTSSDSVATGMELDTKQLYRKSRYDSWIEWSPDDDLDADDEAEHKRYALVVRREKDPDGPGLIFHSITIQSPLIREFLTKVFEGYRGVFTGLKKLVFLPPFHEFFYRWDRFQQVLSETKDDVALKHIELLHKTIAPQIQAHLDVRKDLLSNGIVTFEYLWAIFEPDTEVFLASDTGDRLFLSRDCYYRIGRETKTFILNCEYIDHNGTILGWASTELSIPYFNGHMKIADVSPIPSALVPSISEIKQRLTERGKAFEGLNGMHYKTYSGPYLPRVPGSIFRSRRRNVSLQLQRQNFLTRLA